MRRSWPGSPRRCGGWGCWDDSWEVPTRGGITQARQRLGHEPVKEVFAQVAAPVADEDTAGAFLGPWRLMSMDGFEWDLPATKENIAAFGFAGTGKDEAPAAFPKARVVTIGECASHAQVAAAIGPVASKGSGEQALARSLYPVLGGGEHETGNVQLKTYLRGPGKVLRSQSPDMVRQEIYGYLLTHYAISALICQAATAAAVDPDRVKFKRTVRIIRRRAADPVFSP